jgi:hypothetical protein
MLNQEIVLALFQASITGAGLVFAAYALILTFNKRILSQRAEQYAKACTELLTGMSEAKKKAATLTDSEGDSMWAVDFVNNIKEKNQQLKDNEKLPNYLRSVMFEITFLGYIISTIIGVLWLIGLQNVAVEALALIFFMASTIAFLILGLKSIKEIRKIMIRDYSNVSGEKLFNEVATGAVNLKEIEDAIKKPDK